MLLVRDGQVTVEDAVGGVGGLLVQLLAHERERLALEGGEEVADLIDGLGLEVSQTNGSNLILAQEREITSTDGRWAAVCVGSCSLTDSFAMLTSSSLTRGRLAFALASTRDI